MKDRVPGVVLVFFRCGSSSCYRRLYVVTQVCKLLLIAVFFSGDKAFSEEAGEYCFEEKCWEYKHVKNVRVGGMALSDGTYIRSDNSEREADGETTTTQRIATIVYNGDIADVSIFSYDAGANPYKISFSFGYNLSTSSLIEEKTGIDEVIGVREETILRSIPDIADDMLKNHGNYSSGESVRFSKTLSVRGTPLTTDHTLTVLGATRYQGENYILLRSEYVFELDSVTGSAEGYLMQDAVTSMPRHNAHVVRMKVGENEKVMKSKGYVSILAQ